MGECVPACVCRFVRSLECGCVSVCESLCVRACVCLYACVYVGVCLCASVLS